MGGVRQAAQGQQDKAALLAKLKGKKPQTATYEVVLDPEPLQQLVEARQALDNAEAFGRRVDEARAAVNKAEAAAADASVVLHFQAISRGVYEALMLEHEPTEKQKADKQSYNVDTFMPALIAATIVDPESGTPLFDADEVTAVIAEWNQAEVVQVWNTAINVCTQVRNPALPFGFRPTRG
jgi:hypothetical protein